MYSGPQVPSYDSKLADFDTVPLFMKSLPPEDGLGMNGDTAALEALQSLVHEGTPDEVALNFKEQGNEYFRGKRYREAMGFYTQGIDAKPESLALREALYGNRAACNLELKNFGSVLRDTSSLLLINPKSSKAHYRAGQALVELERYEEALDCCDRCLAFDGINSSVRTLRDRAARLKVEKDRREAEKAERMRKEQNEKRVMNAVIQSLNLIILPSREGYSSPYSPHFDPTFSGLRTDVTPVLFPLFLLYPQYSQSDLIASFDPSSNFVSHLETMFPPSPSASTNSRPAITQPPQFPPWDIYQEYTVGNLALYATTHRRRIFKVGKRMTLRDACDVAANVPSGSERDGLELRDGCLSIVVVPKGQKEQAWVEEFKKKRAADGYDH
ncbi:hypothetical protein FRC03_012819 [Tulasnella sp. 419]|nr:hypothetical protein FRC03_012819 [Tulasnella sp. 419]